MKYVVYYESAPDFMAKVPANIDAHRALWRTFHADGRLLMVGPYTDGAGALAVFSSRAAADEFVKVDPFVKNGVVSRWTIHEWNEVLAP